MSVTTVQFADAARAIGAACRMHRLVAPAFRSPPKTPGRDRALARHGDDVVLAIRLTGRPFVAVLADMVDGVVVANGVTGPEAEAVRRVMWDALERCHSVEVNLAAA